MIKTLLDVLTANYDPSTDKITYEGKSKLVLAHEEGHRQQAKTGKLARVQTVMQGVLIIAIGTVIIETKSPLSAIWMALYLFLMIYLEYDAWNYALKQRD